MNGCKRSLTRTTKTLGTWRNSQTLSSSTTIGSSSLCKPFKLSTFFPTFTPINSRGESFEVKLEENWKKSSFAFILWPEQLMITCPQTCRPMHYPRQKESRQKRNKTRVTFTSISTPRLQLKSFTPSWMPSRSKWKTKIKTRWRRKAKVFSIKSLIASKLIAE